MNLTYENFSPWGRNFFFGFNIQLQGPATTASRKFKIATTIAHIFY
jgi:hypothetical protein